MARANIGQIIAEAWEQAGRLSEYGHEPMTLAWYRGEAFVRLWDFRTGHDAWRRFPTRDVRAGREPKPKPSRTGLLWLMERFGQW